MPQSRMEGAAWSAHSLLTLAPSSSPQDPNFKEITQKMQQQFGGMMGAGGGMPGMPGMPGAGAGGGPPMDPSKYMGAMQEMFSNKAFMEMAEKLGQSIIQVRASEQPSSLNCDFDPRDFAHTPPQSDPNMQQMMQSMQDPSYKAKIEETMRGMKDDPELKPLLEELEKAGPMGMMK